MKNILLLITLLLFQIKAFSQTETGSLEGQIESESGKPLIGINVGLEGTTIGTATNEVGEFTINNIPIGKYNVVTSGVGFESNSEHIEIKTGTSTNLRMVLSEATTQLQAIEIMGRRETSYKTETSFVGTKTATSLKKVPQAVSYVPKEVIADQQAYRIGDVVKNISGVNMFSGYDDFTFRGFRNGSSDSKTINGLRSVGIFGPQPILANIERVEVIKGPASALFANTTPGGTMNYVTKKPLKESRKAIGFTVGSFNTLRANADFTGPMIESGKLLYRLNIGYEDADSYRDLQKNKSVMIAPSVTFLPTDKTKVNFDLVVTQFQGKLDRGQPIFGAEAGTDLNSTPISFALGETNDYHKNNVQYFTLAVNHQFTQNLSINAAYMKYSWDEDLFEHRTSNRFAVDENGNQIPTLMEMQVINRIRKLVSDNLTSYFVYNTKTGPFQHQLVAGFDYIEQGQRRGYGQSFARGYRRIDGTAGNYDPENPDDFIIENGMPVPNIPHFDLEDPQYNVAYPHEYIFNNKVSYGPTKYYTFGFYLQDQVSVGKFDVLLSLRQENYRDVENYETSEENTVKQDKLLPRLGLVYELNDNINLYGTYTESFQPQSVSVLTNPNAGGPFDPLSANMIEFGAKSEWLSDRLVANIAFYQIEQNNILVNANDPGNPDRLEQRGQETSKGIELDVIGSITNNLSITANYAYNNAEITESDNEEEIGRMKENAPKHQGGVWGKINMDKGALNGLGFGVGANFVSERVTFDTYTLGLMLPAYTIFDAAIYYKVDKFNFSANINNIFDETHWTGGYSYVRLFPGAPRNYLLNVAYTF